MIPVVGGKFRRVRTKKLAQESEETFLSHVNHRLAGGEVSRPDPSPAMCIDNYNASSRSKILRCSGAMFGSVLGETQQAGQGAEKTLSIGGSQRNVWRNYNGGNELIVSRLAPASQSQGSVQI